MISNIAFPNKGIKEEGYKSFTKKQIVGENLKNYSTKFYSIMAKIKCSKGPVFVYSNFKEYGGIKSFVKVLEVYGYKNYNTYGEGRKRYAIWSGDEKNSVREEMKAVYNQPSNINGSKLKIFVGSPSVKEGISLYNVRQIHILEPYWNWSRMQQIIGRGIRYCSHKMLPEDERFVKVYVYIATHPYEKETVDQYIMNLAKIKNKLIEQFENALKESAVDCEIFKYGNILAGENNIVCEE